ncbi:MAG TPA: DNA repair protein RadC [Kiloniellales bacterium]|nr:DNA repair protein RadC [Kiloniellales bacterium]
MDRPERPHYHGHRERLRRRVLEKGAASLADHELLEFLLFAAKPRGDTKPLAKALLARFGSLAGVLAAGPRELKTVAEMGEASIAALLVVPDAARRMALEQITDRPVIGSWDRLIAYCRLTMGHEKVEQFRLLFLDKKNRLIADELQQRGTVDHTPVYPREVIKRALELNASALILVHNHPSGDPTPSKADIDMTREIQEAASKLGIAVHDHLVIGRGGQNSFKALGLL